jgi:hypothetical protein
MPQRADDTVFLKPKWITFLTPGARLKNEERPFPLRTKNCNKTKNNYLTRKAPYKFESGSLQRRVRCEPDIRSRRNSSPTTVAAALDEWVLRQGDRGFVLGSVAVTKPGSST